MAELLVIIRSNIIILKEDIEIAPIFRKDVKSPSRVSGIHNILLVLPEALNRYF